jgi:hypothetical protein
MTIAIRETNGPIRIGAVLGAAFHALGNNPLVTFGIALIVAGLPNFLIAYLINSYRDPDSANRGLTLLSAFSTFAFQSLASSALLLPVMRDHEGRKAGLIESVSIFLLRAPRLIGVALLYAIGLTISIMMLLIPFFFVATSWAAVPAVVAAEPVSVNGAFRRGKALMEGARTRIFAIGLVTLAVMFLIAFIALMIEYLIGGESVFLLTPRPELLAIGAIGSTISGAICAAIQCALYLELRDRNDGPSQQLDTIFA